MNFRMLSLFICCSVFYASVYAAARNEEDKPLLISSTTYPTHLPKNITVKEAFEAVRLLGNAYQSGWRGALPNDRDLKHMTIVFGERKKHPENLERLRYKYEHRGQNLHVQVMDRLIEEAAKDQSKKKK